ncbi:MAG: TIGR01777 family oxidoreductase [Opitutales bacterium]
MINFEAQSEFPVSVETLFDWHERPGAFARLAPPWQTVRLVKHEGGIRDGARVEVETRVAGVPQSWKIRHEGFDYGKRFVDVLDSGPFRAWRHEHLFSHLAETRSSLEDRLKIEPMGGGFGNWLQAGFLRGELKQVFKYRHSVLKADLERAKAMGDPAYSGKVLVTGVTGLLGKAVAGYLQTRGYQVVGVSRSGRSPWPGIETIAWDPDNQLIDSGALDDVDVVINLAGESILGAWSQSKMKRVRSSREKSASTLIHAFESNGHWPKLWINASGTGYYGPKPSGAVSEQSESGTGFLAHVCRSWEGILDPIRKRTRVVSARLGAVMSPGGGALSIMLPVFKMGGGGVLGNPDAKMPWIALDDVVYAMESLFYKDVEGPVNFVSPHKITQRDLAKVLSKVLRRPSLIPAPESLIKMTLGSLGKEVFLIDQDVDPEILQTSGFEYSHSSFERMLKHSLGI